MKPRIEPGEFAVALTCPNCGEGGIVPATLSSRLVMIKGEPSVLGLRVKSAKLPHTCDQLTLDRALDSFQEHGR